MGCAKHGLALMCPFLVMATAPKERAAPRNARPARVCIMKAAREGFVCAMASVHASQLQAALLMCALLMTPLPAAVPTVISCPQSAPASKKWMGRANRGGTESTRQTSCPRTRKETI